LGDGNARGFGELATTVDRHERLQIYRMGGHRAR